MRKTSIFVVLLLCGLSPLPALSEIIHATCPPALKMVSSSPVNGSTDIPVDTLITMTWDKTTLQNLTDGIRDLKPALESINIAGGRYGTGTLLTTEWGIGGTVEWDDNREIITPEAPLEPGTQYRVWTYLYMTIRDDRMENCPGIGGEIIFKTSGDPPEDGNPIRSFDLSTLFHGDEIGMANIRGPVTDLNLPLRVVTVKDKSLGPVSFVVYTGIPLMKKGEIVPIESIRTGNIVEATFTGGRVVTVILLDVEQ